MSERTTNSPSRADQRAWWMPAEEMLARRYRGDAVGRRVKLSLAGMRAGLQGRANSHFGTCVGVSDFGQPQRIKVLRDGTKEPLWYEPSWWRITR